MYTPYAICHLQPKEAAAKAKARPQLLCDEGNDSNDSEDVDLVDSDQEQPAHAQKRKRLQKSKDILPAKAPKVEEEDTFKGVASIPPSPERRGARGIGPGVPGATRRVAKAGTAGARGGLDFLTSFLTAKKAAEEVEEGEEGGVQLDMGVEEEEEEEEEEWEDDQGQEA
jgi:hypothetical protein